MNKKVIFVTDGDTVAKKAVEVAARNIGGRCISLSAGNPTSLNADELVRLINEAPKSPVIVMVDDCGNPRTGSGEQVLKEVIEHKEVDVLGVIAVASNTEEEEGIEIHSSITKDKNITSNAVDKDGNERKDNKLIGDTLSILKSLNIPHLIGLGDPGKMKQKDLPEKGAPITTRALEEILRRSGFDSNSN